MKYPVRKLDRAARLFLGVVGAHLLPVASGICQDWPQWRGPNRDGVVQGVRVPEHWPRALKEEWKVEVGIGVASPVVVGDCVFIFTREKDDEFTVCLELASGKEIWRSERNAAPYQPGPGEDQGTAEQRPRSTPAVAEGRVYTLGMSGILTCLDAKSGKLIWSKSSKSLPYGGSSPLVADGLCITHVGDGQSGGLTAFDASTGEVKWCYADGSRHASGSPILVELAGERQVVTAALGGLLGVSATTGKKLWGVSAGAAACVTSVRHKDLLIFAGDKEPLRAVRVEKGDKGLTATEVWRAKGHPLYYNSPVLAGDLLFGMSVGKLGHLFCLDANTGETRWEGPARLGLAEQREGNASALVAGSSLLFLTDRGRLLIVKPTATAYERIAEYNVSDTQTWAHPVLVGNRLLIRDRTTLRCLWIEHGDVKP
jgi:outer membrane protein assembly factor BamB